MTSNDDQPTPDSAQLPIPPGAYPVDDLAAMSPSAAALLLRRATIDAEVEHLACQHVLITRYVETDVVTYSAPFPTGLDALVAAQRFIEQNRSTDARRQFTLTVSPILHAR